MAVVSCSGGTLVAVACWRVLDFEAFFLGGVFLGAGFFEALVVDAPLFFVAAVLGVPFACVIVGSPCFAGGFNLSDTTVRFKRYFSKQGQARLAN